MKSWTSLSETVDESLDNKKSPNTKTFTMKSLNKFGVCLASLACFSLLMPQYSFAVQANKNDQADITVQDISLGSGGVLKGQIMASNGQPHANVPVVLGQRGKELARTTSNAQGEFEFHGLRSGMFHVSAGAAGGMYRVWSQKTAPPKAKSGVLIVDKDEVVRAQIGDWWNNLSLTEKSFVAAGVATAIVLPIAVLQDDDDDAS